MRHAAELLTAGCAARGVAGAVLLAALLAAGAGAGAAAAQVVNGQGAEEIRLLRESAVREATGDLAGAERILREILADRPESLSALLSLERLLRMQERTAELLPLIDRLLAVDPASAIGHQMRLRTYSALDRVAELEQAGESWIRATPRLETPYREIARAWEARGEYAPAVEVLERGRRRVGREDALALELGDQYAALGDYARAVREWNRAVGGDARGLLLVRRRLASLPDGGAQLLPALIDSLTGGRTSIERRRAAAELAIDAGLGTRAEAIARLVAEALTGAERQSFLVETARRADGASLPALAYWGYSTLLAEGGPVEQLLAVRSRLAELALALGDTAAARESYLALERAAAVGSAERRRAAAVRLELTAREGKAAAAAREFDEFRRQFPEAPELDAVAAALAASLAAEGEVERAERLLVGINGPRSNLARGRLALRQGEVARARSAFLAAAPALHGAEATQAIALATLLGRVLPEGGRLLARALARAGTGEVAGAVALLHKGAGELHVSERPAVLDFAATLADLAELREEASRIRREIIAEHPRAPEVAAALLGLARALLEQPSGLEEAQELLRRLILEHPRSALVPQARRELERAQGRVPHS
ncbi:MAG: tetratricopeptide repeat protein [Gemmatimonadetes bacterium]|nr:tetratricopeptide repeat protein [Gemmatimonadota bacterium]